MTSFLFYRQSTAKTGKALAKALGIECGLEIPQDRLDHLIRWGNAERIPKKAATTYNSREAILKASNKFTSLQTLREGGVSVPQSHSLTPDSAVLFPFPALARKVTHTRGTDIRLCLQPSDAKLALEAGCEYLIQYIPTEIEYRVHIFKDQVLKISQKVLTEPDKQIPWIRNHGHGFTFRKVRVPPSAVVTNMCAAAVSLLGLTFGAVDVIVSDQGFPWILEINTAPGLVPSGILKYAKVFSEDMGLDLTEQPEGIEETDDEEVEDPDETTPE